ncbi:MAG: DEAD/DEAH box helicase family protein [Oscillospiraceae bacterium]|nr:DEAD/DEAH box helicase family protein [Oscillospiraceae bacterium]
MIDFGKLSARINGAAIINPVDIFMTLPAKSAKYAYLRSVQAEVLEQWFENRSSKDTIIKMNTGSGKTTVALLILKSCMAENGGMAAYVVPDNYLVDQVIAEANDLGISVATSEKDLSFIRGEAILVINIQKLFNGKSVFGMRNTGNVALDYILIDDVHACVDDVKSQFSMKIDMDSELGNEIFNLYKDDLRNQNEKGYLDICEGDAASVCMAVPFWRIAETKSDLLQIIHQHKEDKKIMFNYPLISDILQYCNCVFSYKSIEIEPYAVPIHKISAFANAKRRVFMSATLCDDSQLVSVFDVDPKTTVITPKLAADIGDRMILCPQAYTPGISDLEIKYKLYEYAKDYNVVVIVPSNFRARFWQDVTNDIYTAINIKEGIDKMRSQKSGLYVLVNKYDGIDLPDDACRIIVLDGLPDARTAYDKIKEHCLQGTISGQKEKIQKIEQGMGRGVRSTNDYCGVIIMGSALVQVLFSQNACSNFSPATKKQNEVSSYLAQDLMGKSLEEIFGVLDYCVTQDTGWTQLSRGALSNLAYDRELRVDAFALVCRIAFNQAALRGQAESARNTLRTLANQTQEGILKGYIMLEQAKYSYFIDPTEAQRVLAAAQTYNHYIIKPIAGAKRRSELNKIKPQAQQIIEKYSEKDVNEYLIDLNAAIDALVFAPSSYKRFEAAMKKLAVLLGMEATQPDDEYGVGPDVLWHMEGMQYAVIECKNEATAEKISKEYCGQLLSSVSWFRKNYPPDCRCIPVIVHPSCCFDFHASPAEDFRVIDAERLALLKQKVRDFCTAVASNGTFKNVKELSQMLAYYQFTPELFFKAYATNPVGQ